MSKYLYVYIMKYIKYYKTEELESNIIILLKYFNNNNKRISYISLKSNNNNIIISILSTLTSVSLFISIYY